MIHDGCIGCKYELESENSEYCIGCKQNAIDKYVNKTNFDMIKNMDEQEFAEWLTDITNDAQMNVGVTCDYKWDKWLKEECCG